MQTLAKPTPQQYLQRLRETATWCAQQRDKTAALQSDLLHPAMMNGAMDGATGTRQEHYTAVESLALTRAHLLATPLLPGDGRLLAYDPESSLADGAANVATQGFFDDDNTPPWDTWLYYIEEKARDEKKWTSFESYLLSWVPAQFIDLVNAGIAVNPEGCLCWATDLDMPFIHQLKHWDLPV